MTIPSFVSHALAFTNSHSAGSAVCDRRRPAWCPSAIAINPSPGRANPGPQRNSYFPSIPSVLGDNEEALEVATTGEFLEAMSRAAGHEVPAIVLFHAGYCRACKAVLPKFRRLAGETKPRGLFVTVKMEDASALASRLGIRQIPSVQVYNGEHGKVEEFPCGPSSVQRLRDTVAEFCDG